MKTTLSRASNFSRSATETIPTAMPPAFPVMCKPACCSFVTSPVYRTVTGKDDCERAAAGSFASSLSFRRRYWSYLSGERTQASRTVPIAVQQRREPVNTADDDFAYLNREREAHHGKVSEP